MKYKAKYFGAIYNGSTGEKSANGSNDAVKTAFDIQIDGKHGPGRPKMTWRQLTEKGDRESGSSRLLTLMTETPGDLV